MNRDNDIRIFSFCLAGVLMLSFRTDPAQIPTARTVQSSQSSDLVTVLAGKYEGRVRLPEGYRHATLIVKDDRLGSNFVLQVLNGETIIGRLAGYLTPGPAGSLSSSAFGSLKVFENAEVIGETGSRSVSLRLTKTNRGIVLMKGNQVFFGTCPRPPGCEGVSGCEPCGP